MTKNESQFLGNYFPVCRMSMQKPSGVELLSHNPLRQIPAGEVMERCEVGASLRTADAFPVRASAVRRLGGCWPRLAKILVFP